VSDVVAEQVEFVWEVSRVSRFRLAISQALVSANARGQVEAASETDRQVNIAAFSEV
jgi:hypothetical protein